MNFPAPFRTFFDVFILPIFSASLLRWNSVPPALHSKFDVVICADCLFFDEFRADLKECFKSVLIPGGLGVITAPRRGKTFGDFKELLNSDPEFEILQDSEDYSERISAVRDRIKNDSNYDENVNYPRLLTFRKKEKPQTNSHL